MGLFITIEGGEFTGKTSVIVPGLKKKLQQLGYTILTSREPGGTPQGEKIRKEIFQKLREGAPQKELAVLFNQARKIHLTEVVIPFLGKYKEKHGIVILDRYIDSTIVYEGFEGGVPLNYLFKLEKQYVNSYYPDITLIAVFPKEQFAPIFQQRQKTAETATQRSKNNWDESDIQTHILRQAYYEKLPKIYKQFHINRQFAFIDASKMPTDVVALAFNEIKPFLPPDKKFDKH